MTPTQRELEKYQRFELFKIVLDRRLEWGDSFPKSPEALAAEVVAIADAGLAEMEKDASPAAAAIIPLIRQRIQNELADERAIHAKHPVTDERIRQFRDGAEHGLKRALTVIKEMEMEPEAEKPDAK